MSVPTPTSEPATITAGDTVTWTKSIPDYLPSAGWTLNYSLQGSTIAGSNSGLITFSSATNSGATYSISIAKATTAAYAPGSYAWTSYVTSSTERHVFENGYIFVLPDPSAAVPSSHAVTVLALIETAIAGRIPRGLQNTVIDGQSLERIPLTELSALRDKYAAEVRAEQNRQRAAAGLPSRKNSFARFTRPR